MSRDPDAQLVQDCLSGDRKAFDLLVAKYEKQLFNAAYRVTNDIDDAMDATQTAFVKAYEKLHTFDPSYRFFSWIYRILVNESLNLISRRRPLEELDSDIVHKARNPEELYGAAQIDQQVHLALQALEPNYRVIVVLKHFQDLSYKEISRIVGVPERTVKSRLFTARRRLKDLLAKRGIVG